MATSLDIRHYDPTLRKRKKRKRLQQKSVGKMSRQEAPVPDAIGSPPVTSMASSGDIDVLNQSGLARSLACLQTPNPTDTLSGAGYIDSTAMDGEAGLSTEHAEDDIQSALSFGDLLSPYCETDGFVLSRGLESMSWPSTTTTQHTVPNTWPGPDEQYYRTPATSCQRQPGPQDVAEVTSMQDSGSSYQIQNLGAKEESDVIPGGNGSQGLGALNGIGVPASWPSAPHSDNISAVLSNGSHSTAVTTPPSDSIATPFGENGALSNNIYPTAAFAGMRAGPCESCETLRAALLVALSAPILIKTGDSSKVWQNSSQDNSLKRNYAEEESASVRSNGVREDVRCHSPDGTRADADRDMSNKVPRSHIQVLLNRKIDTGIDNQRERSSSNNLSRSTRRSSQCRQLSPLSERRLSAWEKEGNSGAWVSSHVNSTLSKASQDQARNSAYTSSREQRRKRGRRCGVCGIIGHNSRTCPDGVERFSTD